MAEIERATSPSASQFEGREERIGVIEVVGRSRIPGDYEWLFATVVSSRKGRNRGRNIPIDDSIRGPLTSEWKLLA